MERDIYSEEMSLLVSLLNQNKDAWGLDVYEESGDKLESVISEFHLTPQGVIELLESEVVPFLEGYECHDEARALKKGLQQIKAKIMKHNLKH